MVRNIKGSSGQQVGRRLKESRQKLGLTQEQLAERAGLHYSYIGQVERGDKNPSLKSLYRLAGALNVGIDYLLEEDGGYRDRTAADLLLSELISLLKDRPEEDVRLVLQVAATMIERIDQLQKD